MSRHYIVNERRILEAVRLFRWITQMLMRLYFSGQVKRIKALEELVPTLEREGKIVAVWHKGTKVYSMPRKNKVLPVSLDHEIACTDLLIRLWRCRVGESQIIPERSFRGFGIVPEGGIRYAEERGTMLILEFCTESNFAHGGVMKSKITRYKKYLPDIEAKFDRDITVLFIIDIKRGRVKDFVDRMQPLLDEPTISGHNGIVRYPFFFTDYKTLRFVPVGNALKAQIYFWHDGKEWTLTGDG
jgi:hypothetical protein